MRAPCCGPDALIGRLPICLGPCSTEQCPFQGPLAILACLHFVPVTEACCDSDFRGETVFLRKQWNCT